MTTRFCSLRLRMMAVALVAALASPLAVGSARGGPVDEATLALPVVSLGFGAAYVAEAMGLWEQEGLRVRISIVPGVGAPNAVLAGSVDFAVGTAASIARANTRGQRLIAITQLMDRMTVEIVLRRDLGESARITAAMPVEQRAQALRGRRIAVDAINATPHLVLKYVARRAGLDAERDVTVTPMQPPSMLAALKSGAIDGFTVSVPWTLMPVREGTAVTLVSTLRGDLSELYPFAFLVVLARPDFCEAKPAVCRKLARGFMRALAAIHDRPAEALAALAKRFDKTDPAILAESFELLRPGTSRTGLVDEAGLRRGHGFLVDTGVLKPEEKLPDVSGLYTNRFVR